MRLEDLQEIQKLDLSTVQITDAEGGVNVEFKDEEVMNKIIEVAKKAFEEEDENLALDKLFNYLVDAAYTEITSEIPEHAKTEKMKNDNEKES